SGGCSFSSSQHPISIQVLHLKLESKEPPAAQGIFYAKNHSVPGDQWDTVAIVVKDIVEFNARWKGNQPNSICTGVHLVRFGDLWCMDVDGVYGEVEDPKSIEEVRQFGDCYAIGRDVRFYVVNNRRVDLYAHLKHVALDS
ncbi:hypothetical protein, partial [Burkholderia ubonensis]|uniref:hypothetical protein n=1 Tax=Burkholderia ubonensis TaxID=101571 RepID=UPI001E386339